MTTSGFKRLTLVTLAAGALAAALSACAPLVVGGVMVGGALVVSDRRTSGAQLEDEGIELRSANRIKDTVGDKAHVNVTSYNRAVLISGEVPDDATRQQAEQVVRRVAEVRQIYNEAAILPASTLGSRSTDTWLTTRAKTALFDVDGIRDFDPTRVKVVTERGIVYLMGLVRAREADAVTAAVRRVPGVQKVVRLFEYLDS